MLGTVGRTAAMIVFLACIWSVPDGAGAQTVHICGNTYGGLNHAAINVERDNGGTLHSISVLADNDTGNVINPCQYDVVVPTQRDLESLRRSTEEGMQSLRAQMNTLRSDLITSANRPAPASEAELQSQIDALRHQIELLEDRVRRLERRG